MKEIAGVVLLYSHVLERPVVEARNYVQRQGIVHAGGKTG
jgi:hypothetical protein